MKRHTIYVAGHLHDTNEQNIIVHMINDTVLLLGS